MDCNKFKEMIWLEIYGELSDENHVLLENHLASCIDCKLEYEETMNAKQILDKKVQLEPHENLVKEMRNELHQRLVLMKKPQLKSTWTGRLWQIASLDFPPAIRMGTAFALLVLGLLIGRQFIPRLEQDTTFSSQATESYDSRLAGMETIEYNPKTNNVELTFRKMEDVTVEGNLNEPAIQKLMANALVSDERPNIRLRTVKALENSQSFGKEILDALVEIIEQDDNPGIRLRALKVLTAVPITPEIKRLITKVMVKVILSDPNSAMRIEAFKRLNKVDDHVINTDLYNAVKSDSSEYIRTQSSRILDRTENPQF